MHLHFSLKIQNLYLSSQPYRRTTCQHIASSTSFHKRVSDDSVVREQMIPDFHFHRLYANWEWYF